MIQEKAIIVSAPSGAGKSTLVHHLMGVFPQLEFSVSACTRPKRAEETDGVDYYFISVAQFQEHIESCDFIEWEEVYQGCFYGTLKSEIRRIWSLDKIPVFDVDVKGGLNLKKYFRKSGLAIFVQPPSMGTLKERLENRGTESPEDLAKRIGRAEKELSFAPKFDTVIVNNELEKAKQEICNLVQSFLQ
ncbi:MAG: guanylate kinase [Bacteroidales bacterium]|nr:guanylate kinase [Bacteroidales bacterium]